MMSKQEKDASIKFQSPLLAKMPPPYWQTRIKKIGINASILLCIALTIWFVNRYRFWADWRLLDPIYLFHDEVYLPFKGNTFNQIFPYGWVWFGTLIVLVSLTVLAWAFTTRWSRGLSILLTKIVIRSQYFTRAYRLFSTSAEFLKLFGIEPKLLFIIVHSLRERLLAELEENQRSYGLFSPRLVPLNTLWLQLGRLAPNVPVQRSVVKILTEWHRLYLLLHRNQEDFRDDIGRFLNSIRFIDWPAVETPDGINPFSFEQLWADTQNLIILGHDRWGSHSPTSETVSNAQTALLLSSERRKLYLDAYTQGIERQLTHNQVVPDPELREWYQLDNLSDIDENPSHSPRMTALHMIPEIGPLFLLIDLHVAYLNELTDWAYGLAESYELLMLLIEWDNSPANESLGRMLSQKPPAVFYLVLSDMVQKDFEQQKRAWQTLFEQESHIVSPSDLALLQHRQASLIRATLTEVP